MDFQSRDRRTFILLTIVLVGHSLRTQAEAVGNHQFVDCFNQYTSSQNDIAERYKNSHMICRMEHAGNESILRPPRVPSIDLDVEMANFARTSNEICRGLKACDLIQDPSMFFKCYSKAVSVV